jgi:hypothetical protein
MAFSRLGDFMNLGLSKKQLDEALKYCSATNMSALETVGIQKPMMNHNRHELTPCLKDFYRPT